MDRILEEANAEEMVGEEAVEHVVDVTLQAVTDYIENAQRHFSEIHPGWTVVLEVLLTEMKRDFEIHE
jgi:hypothetical protein